MTYTYNKSYRLFVLLLMGTVISLTAIAANWRLHPSFDNNPLRIIDSPERTYFLTHQQYYQKNYGGYSFPTLTLFEWDKADPEAGITPLVARVSLSEADIRLADYSPAGDYLFVAYNSGTIDLVTPEGEVTSIDILKRSHVPGGSLINSVTFDSRNGDAWVATDGGYLHIDATTKSVADRATFSKPVKWIAPVGETLVAIIDDRIYHCESLSPRSADEFSMMSEPVSPLTLMPLSDTEFAYLSGAKGGNVSVIAAKRSGGGWSFLNLGSDKFHSLGDNFITAHNYEPNVIPNRDGYLLYSTSKLWQLKRGQNGEESLIYSLPTGGLAMPVGSWDMEDFWSYMDRGKFQRYHASYTDPGADTLATWSAEGEPVRPNAPASFISEFINYSPDHGILLMNHGQTNGLANDAPVTPMLLSGKRNDTWRIYSQVYNVPYSVENDPVLEKSYLNQIRRFPLADPQGLGVDPIDGSWISCGSMWGGAIFMNISDPKRDVAHFAAPNDLFKNFPGFVAEGLQQSWGTICVFSNPDFDTDGSIWMMYGNPFEVGGKHAKTQLKYMRSGDRKAFYEADASQYADLKGWSTIDLPTGSYPSWSSYVLCGKHPKNKNKVFAFLAGEFNTLIIADHHGKPEDSDKVDITTISSIGNEHGWNSRIRYVSSVAEDPRTGEIIITGMDGLFIFDPSAPVVEDQGRGDYLTLRGGQPGDIVPTRGHMYKVIFDDEGRMWVGTRNMGVVGVNKERTEVIARYSADNSPLPSDWVIGLGWNPETHSLMISTDQGLAEVFPDLPAQRRSASEPYLSMTTVSPNYNGTVEIRNITPGEGVVVYDAAGNVVRKIPTSNSTTAEWDFKNTTGDRVPSGHYTITVGRNAPLPIAVMR